MRGQTSARQSRASPSAPARRGQGISINVIVITAIALIVLIVLVVVLLGRVQIFGKGTTEIETETQSRLCSEKGNGCSAMESSCSNGAFAGAEIPKGGWIDCPSFCCK